MSIGLDGGEAFRWTPSDGMVGLGDLPGGDFFSRADAVSFDGSTVVGFSQAVSGSNPYHAFRWTAETGMVDLGYLPGFPPSSQATGVSGDGGIVVGWVGDYTTPNAAFIWDEVHGMRDLRNVLEQDYGLDLSGWTNLRATDISVDGLTIVGYGRDPDGRQEAWIAHIPEPASGLLLALLAITTGRSRRRRGDNRQDNG